MAWGGVGYSRKGQGAAGLEGPSLWWPMEEGLPAGRGLGAARPGQQGREWAPLLLTAWREVRGRGGGRMATHAGHFPLDVLEELLLAAQEARVLELGVVPLWLDQAALLNVDHLPEAICVRRGGGSAASGLGTQPLTPARPPPRWRTREAGGAGKCPALPSWEPCLRWLGGLGLRETPHPP